MAGRGPGVLAARWRRAALLLLLVWVIVTYFFISPLRCSGSPEEVSHIQERMHAVSTQLETLQAQHSALIAQIKASKLSGNLDELDGALLEDGPSEEYEALRRRVYSNTKELWYFASHELARLAASDDPVARAQAVLQQIDDRKSSLLADQERLAAADGRAAWRAREAAQLSALVQRRLRALQHPADCDAARKLVCNLNKGCGFGCQVHHVAYCLIFAYATERTLLLNSVGWRYHARGWNYVFRPLSDSCTYGLDLGNVVQWPDVWFDIFSMEASYNPLKEDVLKPGPMLLSGSEDAKVVSLPFIDSISHKPKFLPLAIPKDLARRIMRFNGDPASWWVGQMLKYLLKPLPHLQKTINDTIAKLGYQSPIVGIHIRRTDKVGTEAAFHHISEYMAHVTQYWRTQDLLLGSPAPRRVYLASDDPAVLEQARTLYPAVTWVGDAGIARAAATHRRYTPAALAGLLVDLTLLSRADYLVCTFSSQVGRVAYELMQTNRADASESVHSLDDIYYFGGQNAHDRRAVIAHDAVAAQEISMKVGDLIGIAGNHWNGFGRGTNRRTNQNGLIPWYKTEDHFLLYPFPEYKEVPLSDNVKNTTAKRS